MELQTGALLQGGKYKIEKVLGQGGFGITYLAEQTNLFRKVCIKEFFMKDYSERDENPEDSEKTVKLETGTFSTAKVVGDFRKRFIKEAINIAKLNHPGIVRIHDYFEENGTAYYVMDYIEGENLLSLVKREGPLSEERAIFYIRQVADALTYLHSQNLMHLDIKPSNIIIRDSDDKAILIDFGTAKCYDSEGTQTSTTPICISTGYAPLELMKVGGVSTFSPETDIYSLGATLYSLVTGQNPPDASERTEMLLEGENLKFPKQISTSLANAIETAMQARKKRPKSVADFLKLIDDESEKTKKEAEEKVRMEAEKKRLAEEKAKKEDENQGGTILQAGKYKIEKTLGQGGSGITYLAEQTNLNRKVCIKAFFISNANADATVLTAVTSGAAEIMGKYRDKFIKEAKTIAKLDHPGIVRIRDVFEENGTAYYVMDFIEGWNLDDMVKREGPLSEDRAIGYIRQVAEALSYVHSHNIMHLDVKPANVIVRKSDDRAILINFGTAKQFGLSAGYAPVELNAGDVKSFSPELDVYSLGATLYYLVTGKNPPDACERMEMIVEGEKFKFPKHISTSLANAIESAMQPRMKRPQSVAEFVNLLKENTPLEDAITSITSIYSVALFDVILVSAGFAKLQTIKTLNETLKLGLKGSKDLVDSVPATIKKRVTKDEADYLKTMIEKFGARVMLIESGSN